MYLFVAKVMRGDISYIAKRFSESNNKYITYFDAKNLYCWAMIQYLPYSRFK